MDAQPRLRRSICTAVNSNPWFAGLPESTRAAILSMATERTLSPGARIFSRGEAPNGIFVVIEGLVRVSGVTRAGRETILDFYGPGTWIGEVSVLSGAQRGHDAEAVGEALVLQLGPTDVEELLSSHAAFSRALLRLEARRLLLVLSAIETYSAQSMEQRLASRLLMLAEHHGTATAEGLEIGLDLSHETLARLIGSTRQRINQFMNDWQRAGTISHHYGRVVLREISELERLAHA